MGQRQPGAAAAAARRREADAVLARLRRREGEAARGVPALRDHLVVVVEDFLFRRYLALAFS